MSIVSLVIAPTLADLFETKNNVVDDAAKVRTEQSNTVSGNSSSKTVILK
jgi:hypothetical protein